MNDDFDIKACVTMEMWEPGEIVASNGYYRLVIPDHMFCDRCDVEILNGETAWIRSVWEGGESNKQYTWCPPCYTALNPLWVEGEIKSIASRFLRWLRS